MNGSRPLAGAGTITALVALCAILGGVIYSEASAPVGEDAVQPFPATAGESPTAHDFSGFTAPAAEAYSEISERPLFSPTRRPTPRQSTPEAIGAVSSFVFAGSIISRDDRVALVHRGQSGKLVRLREGDLLEGWRVVSIEADRVVIEHGSDREELKPRDKVSPNAPRPLPSNATAPGRPLDPS